MSYAKYRDCLVALDEAGFLKGGVDDPLERKFLDTAKLDEAIKAEFNIVTDYDQGLFDTFGLSDDQIVSRLFPGFNLSTEISPQDRAESRLDTADPNLKLRVKEKDDARLEMRKLVWTESSITSTGRVQKLFGNDNPAVVLVEVQVERPDYQPDGTPSAKTHKVKVRFATNNPDIVNTEYVQGRGTRLVGIAKSASADVKMVISRIPGAGDRFKATFGLQVDNAITAVEQVSISRFIAKELEGSQPAPPEANIPQPDASKPNGAKAKAEKADA